MGRTNKNAVPGVYLIHCLPENKFYVGSANDPKRRISDHKVKLKAGVSHHRFLQEAWDRCGGRNAFSFSVIELCPGVSREELMGRESFWQRFYDSTNKEKGYNVEYADGSPTDGTVSNAPVKIGSSINSIKNPVMSIHIDTGKVVEYVNAGDASRSTGCPYQKVGDCLSYWSHTSSSRRSCKGYMFVRKNEYRENFDYINFFHQRKPRPKTEKVVVVPKAYRERDIKKVPAVAVDIPTGVETPYDSITWMIEDMNLVPTKVYKCLNNEFKRYKHKGHWFRRVTE